jgi:hypothetical protein
MHLETGFAKSSLDGPLPLYSVAVIFAFRDRRGLAGL